MATGERGERPAEAGKSGQTDRPINRLQLTCPETKGNLRERKEKFALEEIQRKEKKVYLKKWRLWKPEAGGKDAMAMTLSKLVTKCQQLQSTLNWAESNLVESE